jgi:iron complex transport system substrate-binding protein
MKILLLLLTCLLLTPKVGACPLASNTARITVAGGSLAEILYFLDMEEHIVAVDITSSYPPKAKELPSIGYVRNLSAEGILSLSPTVVIGEDDMGPSEVLAQIKGTGVEIIIVEEKHSATGIIEKIECVADIVGRRDSANDLITQHLLPKIARLDALVSKSKENPMKILFILGMQGGSPLSAGRGVSADGLITMIGGINTMSSFEGWKPVGTEAIIEAAPDVILISTRGLTGFGDIDDLKKHPAFRFTPAAINHKIFAMDGMEMLGFGPRTLSAAVSLAKKIAL